MTARPGWARALASSRKGKVRASIGRSRSRSISFTNRAIVPGGVMVAPVSCRSL